MPERQTGTVAKWLNHKGIGFITPAGKEANEEDVLVHFEQIKQESDDGFKSLAQGAEVEYDLQPDPKNPEKQVAVNVTGKDGADAPPKPKGKGKGSKGRGKGKKGKGKKGKRSSNGEDEEEEEAEE